MWLARKIFPYDVWSVDGDFGWWKQDSTYLIRLVVPVRISDLGIDILLLVEHVIADTLGVSPLHIGVEIDLDDSVGDGILKPCRLSAKATSTT